MPKAKFPAIDFHGHPQRLLDSAEGLASLTASLDTLERAVMVRRGQHVGRAAQNAINTVRATPHKDRVRVLAGIDFRSVGPGWAEKAVAQLEADVAAGAVGVGEISKSLGPVDHEGRTASRLTIDDPDARSGLGGVRPPAHAGVHPHGGSAGVLQADRLQERALARAGAVRGPALSGRAIPEFEELMAERDRMFKKHPNTEFVAAHMGWHANDLGAPRQAARRKCRTSRPRWARCSTTSAASRAPRTSSSSSTRTACCSARIRSSRRSIRITGGYSRRADEYFDYYRDYHAFWKLYGIDLPDDGAEEAVLPERAEAGAAACRNPAGRSRSAAGREGRAYRHRRAGPTFRSGVRLSAISYQLSAISYQLSAISYQLSAISYQLSAISYQLSAQQSAISSAFSSS